MKNCKNYCENCGSNEAIVQIALTDMDGGLVDRVALCFDCAAKTVCFSSKGNMWMMDRKEDLCAGNIRGKMAVTVGCGEATPKRRQKTRRIV